MVSALEKLKAKAFQNEAVRQEYEALSEEFELISSLLKMRASAGLTQEQLAQKMGTKKSNICRLERGNTNPSWATLKKYASACGYDIALNLYVR